MIREYEQILYTFGDMNLPYIFVAEHEAYNDRTIVRRGVVYIQKPNIVLPGQRHGPEFKEGFEHSDALPRDAVFIMRSMGLPYSEISNKQIIKRMKSSTGGCRRSSTKWPTCSNSMTIRIRV